MLEFEIQGHPNSRHPSPISLLPLPTSPIKDNIGSHTFLSSLTPPIPSTRHRDQDPSGLHDLDPNLPQIEFGPLQDMPTFEEFNRDFLGSLNEDGNDTLLLDTNIWGPSGTLIASHSFQLDQESSAILDRFLELYPDI